MTDLHAGAGPVGRRETFDDLFARLGPTLRDLDAERRGHLRTTAFSVALVGPMAALGVAALVATVAGAPGLATSAAYVGGAIAAGIMGVGGLSAQRRTYARCYKERAVGALTAWLAPELRYEPTTVHLREAIKAAGFVPGGHTYTYSEDLFQGVVEGRKAAFCEVRASSHDHDADGDEAHGTGGAFNGLFFRVALDAPVPDHVVVLPAAARLGAEAAAYAAEAPGGGKPVAIDDDAFNAAFQAFAADPGVARALLRRDLRARLVEVAGDRPLFLAWRDGYLYAGLARRGAWLEPSLLRPATSRPQLEGLAADLEAALRLVKDLAPAFGGLGAGGGAAAPAAPAGPVGPAESA